MNREWVICKLGTSFNAAYFSGDLEDAHLALRVGIVWGEVIFVGVGLTLVTRFLLCWQLLSGCLCCWILDVCGFLSWVSSFWLLLIDLVFICVAVNHEFLQLSMVVADLRFVLFELINCCCRFDCALSWDITDQRSSPPPRRLHREADTWCWQDQQSGGSSATDRTLSSDPSTGDRKLI